MRHGRPPDAAGSRTHAMPRGTMGAPAFAATEVMSHAETPQNAEEDPSPSSRGGSAVQAMRILRDTWPLLSQ